MNIASKVSGAAQSPLEAFYFIYDKIEMCKIVI